MKIKYVSDLHMEFGGDINTIFQTDADVLILAGDITTYKSIFDTLRLIADKFKKAVIFVPGNHEYYGISRKYLDEIFKKVDLPNNLHILLNDTITINGILFAGGTGWWDGSNDPYKIGTLDARTRINDFRLIEDLNADNLFGVLWGEEAYRFFSSVLNLGMPTICISHNAPSIRSIAFQFRSSTLNICFANDWENLFNHSNLKAWIHGHTHVTFDYTINDIPVLCNPKGYYKYEENPEFDPNKIFEI